MSYAHRLNLGIRSFLNWIVFILVSHSIKAQAPEPPLPIETLVGNRQLYFQMVVKKSFAPQSKFSFFSVATYSASYDSESADYNITIPAQISYAVGKGFGVMAGTDINSAIGWAPVAGPQYNFATRKFLAVTIASFFFNQDKSLKIFGLYEFRPPINNQLTWYNRLQFMYIHSLASDLHVRSYWYLRSGIKWNSLIFGVGANLDQFGPQKIYKDNYGLFVRWEFN